MRRMRIYTYGLNRRCILFNRRHIYPPAYLFAILLSMVDYASSRIYFRMAMMKQWRNKIQNLVAITDETIFMDRWISEILIRRCS